jgi:hypothetical protein
MTKINTTSLKGEISNELSWNKDKINEIRNSSPITDEEESENKFSLGYNEGRLFVAQTVDQIIDNHHDSEYSELYTYLYTVLDNHLNWMTVSYPGEDKTHKNNCLRRYHNGFVLGRMDLVRDLMGLVLVEKLISDIRLKMVITDENN